MESTRTIYFLTTKDMSKPLLIIGKPHSSKTVFIAQFYSRLQKRKSKLSLYKPVDDLSAITAAREALANGEEPEATNTERSVNLILPIQFGEQQIELVCPDYGGEQINTILTSREVDKKWLDAIRGSDNWIFFIRLNNISEQLDISKITVTDEHIHGSGEVADIPFSISDQSALIELLQIFLHSKEHDYHFKNSKIKLTVVLTCWDELETKEKPKQVLQNNLPLLLNFIESNWKADKLKIIGLSAQGFPLDRDENKEKYQIEGSENFGYLIKEDGQETTDITELISEAL
jgi:Double-GTPase 1